MPSLLAISLLLFPEPAAGFSPLPLDEVGWWSQYQRTPTDAVIRYHGYNPAMYHIAVPDCSRLGDYAWITVNESAPVMARVFDCAGNDGTAEWMSSNGIIGELGYYLAERFDVVGRGGVRATIRWIEDDDYQPTAD